jgi:hypothetical protein
MNNILNKEDQDKYLLTKRTERAVQRLEIDKQAYENGILRLKKELEWATASYNREIEQIKAEEKNIERKAKQKNLKIK